jgi:hypothetical protein
VYQNSKDLPKCQALLSRNKSETMKTVQLDNIKTPIDSTICSNSTTQDQLATLNTKSQLNKIIVNKDGSPDHLAINIYWDSLRSWYAPLREHQYDGNVVQIKKLKTQGVYSKADYLAQKHGVSKATIRRKLAKLEKLGLIQRSFEHKSYATTDSYNKRIVYVLKDTPYFINPYGVDIKDIKKIVPQTNADYLKTKHGIIFTTNIDQNKRIEVGGMCTPVDTKELRESFNKLKDRSNESNSFAFNNSNTSVENKTNDFVETKNSVIEEGVNTAATVYTLKPKKHSNSRKKPTNAETKAKKAKTFLFNQFKTPKPLKDFYPLSIEESSELQIKSGRDFTLNAQNEILLDMATNRPQLQEHRFKSKAQFIAYMSKALYYEKRDAEKISNANFSIKANETEEVAAKRAKAANIEAYLSKVEQRAIVSRDDEIQFRAKLGGTLEPELAYNILSNLSRFSKEDDVFKLIMSKEVEITDFAKEIILNQVNAVGAYNGVERLKFVVVGNVSTAYHNSNKPEPVKLPEGIWGDVLRKLIAEYGVDAYKNWFSKLTASIDETTRTIAITATSGMVQDWISSKYGDMMAKIIAGMNFELSSMRV